MSGANFNECTETNREGETRDGLEEEPRESYTEFTRCFIIVQEHIVDVLLGEYYLENYCYQDKRIGDLISRGLVIHQGRYKIGHGYHCHREKEEYQECHEYRRVPKHVKHA